jgi:hypothetical protein
MEQINIAICLAPAAALLAGSPALAADTPDALAKAVLEKSSVRPGVTVRPRSALGYRPPAPEAIGLAVGLRALRGSSPSGAAALS